MHLLPPEGGKCTGFAALRFNVGVANRPEQTGALDPARDAIAPVRLSDLVAALSLGIDLGFGQPMEHVLRQCLIAQRLAERVGLDDGERSVVYYTALLVNVGCHADAHEQAKWFGDDIELKSHKYDYELGSVRGALASLRLVGSGNHRCIDSGSVSSCVVGSSRSGRDDRSACRARVRARQ